MSYVQNIWPLLSLTFAIKLSTKDLVTIVTQTLSLGRIQYRRFLAICRWLMGFVKTPKYFQHNYKVLHGGQGSKAFGGSWVDLAIFELLKEYVPMNICRFNKFSLFWKIFRTIITYYKSDIMAFYSLNTELHVTNNKSHFLLKISEKAS